MLDGFFSSVLVNIFDIYVWFCVFMCDIEGEIRWFCYVVEVDYEVFRYWLFGIYGSKYCKWGMKLFLLKFFLKVLVLVMIEEGVVFNLLIFESLFFYKRIVNYIVL